MNVSCRPLQFRPTGPPKEQGLLLQQLVLQLMNAT
jgi:hypothetical protein